MTDKTKLARAMIKPLVWDMGCAGCELPSSYSIHGDDEDGFTVHVGWRTLTETLRGSDGDDLIFATEADAQSAAEAEYIGFMANALKLDAVAELAEAAKELRSEHFAEIRDHESDRDKMPVRIGHIRRIAATLAKFTGDAA